MVFSCGEVIADLIEMENGTYKFCVGGAPLNVAYIINKLGGNVIFCGNVGDDALGKQIIDFIKGSRMSLEYLSIDKNRNTSIAFVNSQKKRGKNFYVC